MLAMFFHIELVSSKGELSILTIFKKIQFTHIKL